MALMSQTDGARNLCHSRRPSRRGAYLQQAPYYLPLADEVEVFLAAYAARLPVLLKGPTGCGKTRFVNTWPIYSTASRNMPQMSGWQ